MHDSIHWIFVPCCIITFVTNSSAVVILQFDVEETLVKLPLPECWVVRYNHMPALFMIYEHSMISL